jgi:Protein of unknown function (DUF1592)/Protein of unknown function (DUF1588)/Protein of unknown function (DUF1595)
MRTVSSRFGASLSVLFVVLGSSALGACSNDSTTTRNPSAAGEAGGPPTGGSASTGGSGNVAGSPGVDPTTCLAEPVTTQKRLVRLTDNQVVNTYTALFKDAAPAMFKDEEITPANLRAFPPLATIGTTLGQSDFDLRDRASRRAMTYVGSNLATLTTCGATPTDATCGLTAVLKFAESAYRRPLTTEETASYQQLWTELTTSNGGSVAEAIEHGYDAVLLSPGFLYRTEVGDGWTSAGPLTSYELASELSYFLADGPPDAELLASAASNQLTDPATGKEALRAHARRILGTDAAKANIEAAMVSYFQLTTVPGIVIDEGTIDGIEVTSGLKNSMLREGEEFLKRTLWQGSLGDLVTSRRTWINTQLAPLYGVTLQGGDVNTFTEIMLGEDRAGLLTLSPFLTSKSRPDGTSVVGRGLAVNAALVCAENPPFPEGNPLVEDAIASQSGWTEKQKADFRADPMKGVACAGCHRQFDAMGLVLENYDALGRRRTNDPKGNPIDLAWTTSTLPASFAYDQNGDGVDDPAVVAGPVALAQALLRDEPTWGSNALTRCMALNFINYALADESQGSARASGGVPTDSCAVRAVTNAFGASSEKTFTSLLAEIAASETLAHRLPGM